MYRVCNPAASDFIITKNTDFNVTFIVNNSKLLDTHLEIRNNLSGFRNVTETLCYPYYESTVLDNGTILSTYISNCTQVIGERYVEEYGWQRFEPLGYNLKAGDCYDIKVVGSYPPAYGAGSVNIDNILGYNGLYFSEYAVWLTGWDRRKAFYVNSSNGSRMNYPLGLFEAAGGPARSTCINFTGLDNFDTAKKGELRVLDNNTNATVPFEVINNGSDWVCLVVVLNLTGNGNDSFYLYWNNSAAPNITYSGDFDVLSDTSIQVSNHQFGFQGSIIMGLDNFSFGNSGNGFWGTGVTNNNGVGATLERSVGSCTIKEINGSVVKWVNCSNGGSGMLCMFAAYNNFTRCIFSGFDANNDDGMYTIFGDGTATPGTAFLRNNDGTIYTAHGLNADNRDAAGIIASGKDKFDAKAYVYWNASWAISIIKANNTVGYTRESTGTDPQYTMASESFHGNYRWNLNKVNVYVGFTGNTSSSVHETWAWLEKKPVISFGSNESPTSTNFVNENQGRTAIEAGINSSIIGTGATRYTDQQIYARNLSNAQIVGRFDKVAANGNQRWAFNYLTGNDTYVNMFNLTPTLYTLEMSNLTSSQITDMVVNLINSTKQ
ncbi:hypothetical protein HY637_05695 [Candidatus Woesearchaeota archaeon]|nr:hypothetical protein [Candidatus Woesearchaeota archaeon]